MGAVPRQYRRPREDCTVAGVVLSDSSVWEFGQQTTPYVGAMVAGWASDRPDGGRHGWLVSQAVRLACARRLGRITDSDYRRATEALECRFKELLWSHGDRRDPTPGEIAGALAWGAWRTSTLTDEQATDEVGGGDEDSNDETANRHDGVYLPSEFFESRAALRHVRDAALSFLAAPDATLMAVLATISASIPPSVRVDTGSMAPLPMHLFADLVSVSGAGKTGALSATKKFLKINPGWSSDPFSAPDGLKVVLDEPFPHIAKPRTGEGIAEQFWGQIVHIDDKGKKLPPIRARIRSNVLLLTDEGSGLVKLIKDDKGTVGETLREAWSGTLIGQSNADASKYRPVDQGSYTVAVVTGMQLSVLGGLLTRDELEKGTPQRFIFSWCKPNRAEITPEFISGIIDPGDLEVAIPSRGLRLCESLRARVRNERIASLLSDDSHQAARPIESQRLAAVARLAGLLAILDGRTDTDDEDLLIVTEDDWELAETIFATSVAIADLAIAERRNSAATAKRAERERNLAESIEDDEARETPEGRAAARIINYLREADGPGPHRWSGQGGIRAKFNSNQIKTADAALEQLVGRRVRKVKTGRTVSIELLV